MRRAGACEAGTCGAEDLRGRRPAGPGPAGPGAGEVARVKVAFVLGTTAGGTGRHVQMLAAGCAVPWPAG